MGNTARPGAPDRKIRKAPRMSADTRLSLLAALQNPDGRDAWGRFAERYGGIIRNWCLERCRALGAADADEAADEVSAELVASIHRRMQSYDLAKHRPGGYRAWLRRAALNALSDYLNKASLHQGAGRSTAHDMLAEVQAPESLGDAIEMEYRREVLENVIIPQVQAELGKDWAAVVALGLIDGRGGKTGRAAKDVAAEFGTTPGRLLQLKSRALRRMRALAEEWEAQEDH
jgi:DNA-directed RNA polymerase specialized sigma24 family protein